MKEEFKKFDEESIEVTTKKLIDRATLEEEQEGLQERLDRINQILALFEE